MRLRWANNISIFLRSRFEVSRRPSSRLSRAMLRAPSWIERGIFRAGAFGQQRGFSWQASGCKVELVTRAVWSGIAHGVGDADVAEEVL
jgi:hypothetical protein